MTQTPPTIVLHIGEHEPLVWLVSILFTKDFWQRPKLTQTNYLLENFAQNTPPQPPTYPNLEAVYNAAADFVSQTGEAAKCLEAAKEAIQQGELEYYSPPPDQWGEKPFHHPERDVDSYKFLLWVEKKLQIPQEIVDSCHYLIHSAISRKQEVERVAYAYPAITDADFERLRKEPLWRIGSAIMYIMGRRARSVEKEADYRDDNDLFRRMLQYVLDADKAGQLTVIGYNRSSVVEEEKKPVDRYMLDAQVKPEEFIGWVATLPVELPMPANQKPATLAPMPVATTPEMQLMFEGMEHFWGDASKPAPLKKVVTSWLQENAPRFGITLSQNLAEGMDTIMRPPEARGGGLKSQKG